MRTRFGQFTVDSDTRQLLRDDADIHLSPKAFDLLWALIQERPRVIEKTELHARIWPDTYVSDANLNVLIEKSGARSMTSRKAGLHPNRTQWGSRFVERPPTCRPPGRRRRRCFAG